MGHLIVEGSHMINQSLCKSLIHCTSTKNKSDTGVGLRLSRLVINKMDGVIDL